VSENSTPEGFKMSELGLLPDEWYKRPPSVEEIPDGYFIIQADAGYRNGITGISVIIKTRDHEYTPQDYSARTKGPIHAELSSIKKGLDRLNGIRKRKDIKKAVVYNDNLYAYYFLVGLWSGRKHYIKKVLDDIRRIVNRLGVDVVFIHIKCRHNRRVDRRAGKKRKSEEKRKEEQIKARVLKLEETIERSREIRIIENNGIYEAVSSSDSNKRYRVSIGPLSCECPWWQNKWENKPIEAVLARSLPCKHMCALAEHLDIDIFHVFERQIGRVD
jgi:hypothetical protein